MALLQKPTRSHSAHNSQASNQSNLHISRVYLLRLARKERDIYVGDAQYIYRVEEKVLVTSIIGDGHRTHEHLWLKRRTLLLFAFGEVNLYRFYLLEVRVFFLY